MASVTKAKCVGCGKKDPQGNFYQPQVGHLKDGKWMTEHDRICGDCLSPQSTTMWLYCYECADHYKAKPAWRDVIGHSAPGRPCPCPKHSAEKESPKVACVVCNATVSVPEAQSNYRGQWYCELHYPNKMCGAFYCRTMLYQNQPGVKKPSPSNNILAHFCPDCFPVRHTVEGAPKTYHPYSWDYRVDCACRACKYLSGKGPLWPPSIATKYDGKCHGCSVPVVKVKTLCYKDMYYCHCCEQRAFVDCPRCKKKKHSKEFINNATPYPNSGYVSCRACMMELKYWLCEGSCQRWFKEGVECNCDGVLSYNYSPPELYFQWGARQFNRIIPRTPFMGLELEVEAQVGKSSRKAGASLAREHVGDFCYIVHDGSLLGTEKHSEVPGASPELIGGQKGFEIVTHPFTYEWLMENWFRVESLVQALTKSGYRAWEGGRCGMHIHISRAPMTELHQMKFIRFMMGSTNLVMCIGQRDYRDPHLQHFAPFDKENRARFIEKVRANQNPIWNGHKQGHYSAVNANKPHTLEGRWFRGSLNPESIRKNIEFMHSVWFFTKAFGFTSANEFNYIDWLRQTPQSKDYRVLLNYIETRYLTRPFRGLDR